LLAVLLVSGWLALAVLPSRSTLARLEPHITPYLTRDQFEALTHQQGIPYERKPCGAFRPDRDCFWVPLDGVNWGCTLELWFRKSGTISGACIRDPQGRVWKQLIAVHPPR
jgi:hypothetical protein